MLSHNITDWKDTEKNTYELQYSYVCTSIY